MIIREAYLKRIRPFYEMDLIKVIVGIRRSGKSVLLKQIEAELIRSGVEDSKIIYLNFEDLENSFIENEMDLHKYVKDQIKDHQKYYLFFDEIQNVMNFEKAINSFRATLNCSIFITGSNAKLLSGELATHLSGRYVSFLVMPFSFKEYCEINAIDNDRISDDVFFEYLNYGGMPQRFLMKTESETKVYLKDLYNSIVLRDIVQRSKIKDVDILNRIVEYMVMNTSQTFSAKSISKYFESVNRKVSTETLYAYLEFITSSLIMNKAVRYDIRGKQVLTRSDKYYLTDLGLSKINNTGFKTEIGALIENVIYNELIYRGYEVYVGKTTNGEIDFVLMDGDQRSYYQVAYLLADENVVKREFGAYDSINDNFPKYVLSLDKLDFSREGIKHINIIDFLLDR
ncbi:ATP-binding protein [Fusibacter sp. 3D3]|uniref:ATP-binding protein n=1 Tax=Fusibacter sp. 3D3 TaxID=1048380 RepID=UPI000852D58A|nr:ATP-binding protein [Fusibacter sp. 3D3]GAU79674.1 ATPase component BioM of energizing module of biotin ECF transporter [Fusibacter sp. 3D3]